MKEEDESEMMNKLHSFSIKRYSSPDARTSESQNRLLTNDSEVLFDKPAICVKPKMFYVQERITSTKMFDFINSI